MSDRDEYIPNVKQISVYANFPPLPKTWQWVRPLLCALHVFRPGQYTLTLKEMAADDEFKYSVLQVEEVKEVFETHPQESSNFFHSIIDGMKAGKDIADKKPQKYVIATGIDDPKWFKSLKSSEKRRLEEAIDEVNPELKKKLEPVMETITLALLELSGLQSLISSSEEATVPPTK